MSKLLSAAALTAATSLLTSIAAAGTLSGSVRDSEGKALEGVMVRVQDVRSGMAESVFTDAQGAFSLTTDLSGTLGLRLRLPYYTDFTSTVELGSDSRQESHYRLRPMTDEQAISDSLPAAYHFGSLPFETGEDAVFNRYQFQRDCLSCHQLGNPMTRQPRSPESWELSIERMHRYVSSRFDEALKKRRSVMLSEGFDGKPLEVRPNFPLDPSLAKTKFYEYRMEKGIVPHDAIINPNDGLIYTVDQGADHMAITDPATGETVYISQRGNGQSYWQPESGKQEVSSFKPGSRSGPHSLDLGHDGKYYVTNTRSNTIGVFNPRTRQWEPSHVIGGGARYPHTIRVGLDGMVWFTVAGTEQVGRLNPTTGKTDVIRLPDVSSGGLAGSTQPYGIDIDPQDGAVWYGRLFGDRVGRIDSKTLALQEWASPVRGPRRMRFDAGGALWLTGYSEGVLARLETRDDGFSSKLYEMPEFAAGFRPAPYALGVHPQTGDVWINENMTDRLFRFIPAEERFVVYPVPLAGSYTRDFSFTADGKACTSNNPLPITALEGGVAEILCIEVR